MHSSVLEERANYCILVSEALFRTDEACFFVAVDSNALPRGGEG